MVDRSKKLPAFFYQTATGKGAGTGLDHGAYRRGWPLGMPYCRSLGGGLWEVRSDLMDGKIGRVIFCVVGGRMALLHGFIKKTQKTPGHDLQVALRRMKEVL